MAPIKTHSRPHGGRWSLSPQARSNIRLALVACAVVATVGVLAIVTLQAHRAEVALDDAAAQTLRDYTGYAGRMMGAEVLRRFGEQRAAILSPVTGNANRDVPPPSLDDIAARGTAWFTSFKATGDLGLGYFRLDRRTGVLETRGAIDAALGARVADTLRLLLAARRGLGEPDLIVVTQGDVPHSVAFARLVAPGGAVAAVYGFTYSRSRVVAAVADRVFDETPLLPTSYAGSRWNYDTTTVQAGEIGNESLLGMRISERGGKVLWQSRRASAAERSPYREKVVLSTAAGGMVVETALLPAGKPSLAPSIVRRAQRWSLGALLAITTMLAAVSLVALGGERLGARARRVEAMQQLALGLRHELNNALASVMLNAELLAEETKDPMLRERVESIVEQADRMRSVLKRLEKSDQLDVVPYLDEGYMVDLSETPG